MKNFNILLFTFCMIPVSLIYAQNFNDNIIGKWEKIRERSENKKPKIDVGELIIDDDSFIKEKKTKKDHRFSKYYYVFTKKNFYEYRLGLGKKSTFFVKNETIYINGVPLYKINKKSKNRLIINQIEEDKIIYLKRVDVDLSDFQLID